MKKHNRFNSFLQLYNAVSQQVPTTDIYSSVREVLTVSELILQQKCVLCSCRPQKRPQSEAIPASKLYIICEYASEWKEKRESGLARPERERQWSLETESVALCESVCVDAFIQRCVCGWM